MSQYPFTQNPFDPSSPEPTPLPLTPTQPLSDNEEDSSSEELSYRSFPDLESYFSLFPNVDLETRAKICRVYVSSINIRLGKYGRKQPKKAKRSLQAELDEEASNPSH
jgi:hypothetical protein